MTTFPSATDYQSAVLNPKHVFQDKDLRSATVKTNLWGMPAVSAGGFALTYFFETPVGNKWVVRCFKKEIESRKQRYIEISQFLNKHKEPFFTTAEYIQQGILVNGQWYPIVKMTQIEGKTLNSFIESNLGESKKLINLANQFRDLVVRLEQLGIAHGDLQHGNIMISNDQLVLIDYDGMYVPALNGHQSVEAGHRSYQHPLRNAEFWPDLDRFSAIVIYLGLKASSLNPNLWQKYSNGDNLLFQSTDFANPFTSPLLQELESLPGLKQHVTNFRLSCKLPLLSIPRLFDFLDGKIPQDRAVAINSEDDSSQQLSPYPIIDATNRLMLLNLVGEVVQVVGKIIDGTYGKAINQTSYCFLNFGNFTQGSMALVMWSEALQLFTQQNKEPKSYIGKWVSVTGRLSSYKAHGRPTQPQIVIDLPTQIEVLSGKTEAEKRIDSYKQPQLEIAPVSIDFGDITNGQEKEQWITFKNTGGWVLKSHLQSFPAWLDISAHDVQCAANSMAHVKIRTVTQSLSPKVLSHDLLVVSNDGNKTIQIRAKVIHAPILSIVSPTLDFGEIAIGQDKELSFIIQNTGKGILESQINNSSPWLAIDQNKVHCPAGCTVKVKVQLLTKHAPNIQMKPIGTFETYQLLSGKLVITSNGGQQEIHINAKILASSPLIITPVVPILQVTPIIVHFGELTPGKDKVQWLRIRNPGAGKLEIQFQNRPAWLEITPNKTSCTSTSEAIKVKLVANLPSPAHGYQLDSVGAKQLLSHKLSISSNGGIETVEIQASLNLVAQPKTQQGILQSEDEIIEKKKAETSPKVPIKTPQLSSWPAVKLASRLLKALFIGTSIFLIFSYVMSGLPTRSNRFNEVLSPFILNITKLLDEEESTPTATFQASPMVDDNKAVRVLRAPTAITPTPQPLNAVIISIPITVTLTPTITDAALPTSEHLTYTTTLAQFFCRLGMCAGKEAYIQNNTGITSITSVNPIKVDLTITDANVLSATILPISRIPITATTPPASPTSQSSCRSKNPITLLSPIDTTSNGAITFSWQWHGKLPKDCGFEVRVWRDGEPPKGVHDAVKDNLNGEIRRNSPNTYSLHVSNMQDTPSVQGHSGEYFWTVILVKLRPTYEETDLQAKPQRFWFRSSSD